MSYNLPTRSLVKNDQNMMVARPDVPRSRFLSSATVNTSFDAGYLIPFLVEEVLPGDHLKYDVTAYIRMATPLFPIFDNQIVETFFFFVPNRLVWKNWVKFMGEVDVGESPYDFGVPQAQLMGGAAPRSLGDYFGLPTYSGAIDPTTAVYVNELPFRAYQLIFNEWFRDQNIQTLRTEFTYDDFGRVFGYETATGFPYNRNKMHDYFTSCLPWPSKFPSADVPFTGKLPVSGIGFPSGTSWLATSVPVYESPGSGIGAPPVSYPYYTITPAYTRGTGNIDPVWPDVYVDLAQAGGIGLNALRSAWMVQQLTERDARGGTRYVELLKSHFGVESPDARLQRPEYIGGGRSPLQVTPIAQTVSTTDTPLGALGGAGTSVGSHRASYSSVEHGFIIGLINVQSELSYSQGVHRMWSRYTRYDYYWPTLAHLGEQAVLTRELYAWDDTLQNPNDHVFGYQERWHEYRSMTSRVTGAFRTNSDETLDGWHLSQYFNGQPLLNEAFIWDNPPMARILAAGALAQGQQYLANMLVRRDAVRPMPIYSTPAQLGRF